MSRIQDTYQQPPLVEVWFLGRSIETRSGVLVLELFDSVSSWIDPIANKEVPFEAGDVWQDVGAVDGETLLLDEDVGLS